MPDVALGRSEWTDEEARHLAGCANCRAEWAVVRAAQRLGASLPVPDPAVTAARALGRLAGERARTRSRARVWMAVGLAAAAVLGLAVWTKGGGSKATVPSPPSVTTPVAVEPALTDTPTVATRPAPRPKVELPLPELDSLPAEALDSMLRVLDEPLARADADAVPLGDAGDQELARALAGLEG
jgi:hypothetical protein